MEMEKLRLRCPSCAKLYEVSVADIKSRSPQFDCLSCATRFGFQYDNIFSPQLETFVVSSSPEMEQARSFQQELEAQSFAALQQEIENSAQENGKKSNQKDSSKACPKCGAINENKTGKKMEECYSCHVIFSRLEELPLDPTLKAQPSLVRKWKNLIVNFNNKELHEDFLNSCHQLDALRFAILKYEELKSAQGGRDEVSEQMIFKAHGLLQVTLSGKAEGDLRFQKESAVPRQSWYKYILWAPLGVSILMILTGFFSLSLRNLVGAGVSVMLLTFGLILFWKGRISLSDFH
jgi:transposase-like protein